jgi:hypothetical protein
MIGLPWLKPEYPIWASVWRILRFSCPGHNEIAARTGPFTARQKFKSFHEKAGECQVGFVFSSLLEVFLLLSQAASVAILPSALFG